MEANWPLVYDALARVGQASVRSCAGAIGTMAIETASKFAPCRELYNDPPGQYAYFEGMYGPQTNAGRQLGNTAQGDGARFPGRGDIQITGRGNYTRYGARIGVDLVSNPDAALDPKNAAEIFAAYWVDHDIQSSADAENWAGVRQKVQGGSAGLPRLIQIAGALMDSARSRGLA